MTDPEMADATYISQSPGDGGKNHCQGKTRRDPATMGGQTALNCALDLASTACWKNTASR